MGVTACVALLSATQILEVLFRPRTILLRCSSSGWLCTPGLGILALWCQVNAFPVLLPMHRAAGVTKQSLTNAPIPCVLHASVRQSLHRQLRATVCIRFGRGSCERCCCNTCSGRRQNTAHDYAPCTRTAPAAALTTNALYILLELACGAFVHRHNMCSTGM